MTAPSPSLAGASDADRVKEALHQEITGYLEHHYGLVHHSAYGIAYRLAYSVESPLASLLADLAALRTRAEEAEKERDRLAVRRMQWANLADEAAGDANEQAARVRTLEARVAQLEAALKKIARNEATVFDESEGCDVLVAMGEDELSEIAARALNPEGETSHG